MKHQTFDLIEAKTDDGEAGTFSAYASTFGNVDRGGDRMLPGAFSKSLRKLRESGKSLPIILSHQWDSLTHYVGEADPRAIYEDDHGLMVQGQLFMDEPEGRKVHKLMKKGLLTGWSFGYQVAKDGSKKDANGVREISDVELFECGPTLVGMNPSAELQEVKAAVAESAVATEVEDLEREERDELVERSRAEYQARKTAEQDERREAEERHRRTYNFPRPRTRIVFAGSKWTESLADEPGGATDEQIAAREQQRADEDWKRREIHRARAARAAQADPAISILGLRVERRTGKVL